MADLSLFAARMQETMAKLEEEYPEVPEVEELEPEVVYPDDLICPKCNHACFLPVDFGCGHVYCAGCIWQLIWKEENPACYKCGSSNYNFCYLEGSESMGKGRFYKHRGHVCLFLLLMKFQYMDRALWECELDDEEYRVQAPRDLAQPDVNTPGIDPAKLKDLQSEEKAHREKAMREHSDLLVNLLFRVPVTALKSHLKYMRFRRVRMQDRLVYLLPNYQNW